MKHHGRPCSVWASDELLRKRGQVLERRADPDFVVLRADDGRRVSIVTDTLLPPGASTERQVLVPAKVGSSETNSRARLPLRH